MLGQMSVLNNDQLREIQGGSFLGTLIAVSSLAYIAGKAAAYFENDRSESVEETTIENCYCTCQCSA